MDLQKETSRQPDTEQLYARKVIQLERRIRRERKELHSTGWDVPHWNEPVTLIDLAWLFVALEGNWQAATMRLYRAALLWHFKCIGTPEAREAELIVTFTDEDEEARTQRLERNRMRRKAVKKTHPNTSTKKLKTLSRDKLAQLIERLRAAKSQYGDATADWLLAGALTGLRPSEWQRAEIAEVDHRTVLRVKNAKHTNGRAHGQYRTLNVSEVDDHDLAIIRGHISRIQEVALRGGYNQLYKQCRQLLLRAGQHVLGNTRRTVSLYLGRHLFAADAKNDHDRDELAALLGHASNETASVHYARRRYGQRGRLKVKASSEDIAAVQKQHGLRASKPR